MSSIERKDYCFDVVQQLNALLDARGTLFMMQLEMGQDDADLIYIRESVRVLKHVNELWMQDILKRMEGKPAIIDLRRGEEIRKNVESVVDWLRKINSRFRPLEAEMRVIETAKTAFEYYCKEPQQILSSLTSDDKAYLYLCASVSDGMEEVAEEDIY